MHGVWTALVTPFLASDPNELDLPSFRALVQDQVRAGVSGIIPCGTTGEAPTLTLEEKKQLIEIALELTAGTSTRVFVGTGSNDTDETIEFSRWVSLKKAAGVLVVTPYYNKPSQAGLEKHFIQIADAVDCEVCLYNVPGRTGVSLMPETIARLASHPRIRSLKEATGNVQLTSEIRDVLKQNQKSMDILSGDDATWLPLLAVGAKGIVSVSSNLFPRGMNSIYSFFEQGKFAQALEAHEKYFPLFRDLFVESNPGPIKQALHWAGWCSPTMRSPLAELTAASNKTLENSLLRCGIKKERAAQ